ncbi:MAG: radical SAM-associated putative lipoprotein [Bacteroidales bacterium]|nr:radical SAM-associated putative lipoprotein [Bacteroidales bacterium]
MKIKYLKLKNWLWIALGSLLGINMSCKVAVATEYGAPESVYTVKGQVTNPESEPVSGIGIRMINYYNDTANNREWIYTPVAYTDSTGRYDISTTDLPYRDTMYVYFFDIDSSENGQYADTMVMASFKEATFTGGDGNWYQGAATVTKNVQLRRIGE